MNATKALIWMMVMMFILMDLVFIYDLTVNHRTREVYSTHNDDITVHKSSFTGRVVNSIDLSKKNESKLTKRTMNESVKNETSPKVIPVKLLSSKEKAIIMIDGKNVVNAHSDEARGINIVVVNQATGTVLTKRVFDTYYPGGSEKMEIFLESIMPGRYLFFAIKDEATYSLKDSTRLMLQQMGSRVADSLHWRDMWVFAVQKRGQVFGEDYAKSPSLSQWGELVALSISVPLGSHPKICTCKD